MPVIALGELRAGFAVARRSDENEAELEAFLASPAVEVLPVDSEVSRHYAAIVADLRRAGTPVPTNDIWVAATAARCGATVLTSDTHFGKIVKVGSVIVEP